MLHTLHLIGPDLLFVLSWAIGVVGVVCCIVATYGLLARDWSVERALAWMAPTALSRMMDAFGWWALVATALCLLGCWLWSRYERRSALRSAPESCNVVPR